MKKNMRLEETKEILTNLSHNSQELTRTVDKICEHFNKIEFSLNCHFTKIEYSEKFKPRKTHPQFWLKYALDESTIILDPAPNDCWKKRIGEVWKLFWSSNGKTWEPLWKAPSSFKILTSLVMPIFLQNMYEKRKEFIKISNDSLDAICEINYDNTVQE